MSADHPTAATVRGFVRRLEAGEPVPIAELVAVGVITEAELADPFGTLAALLLAEPT